MEPKPSESPNMKGIGSDIHQVFNQRKIHKVVLASQSSLFKEIFEAKEFSPKPVNPKIIRVRNVEPAALETFRQLPATQLRMRNWTSAFTLIQHNRLDAQEWFYEVCTNFLMIFYCL